MNLIFYVLTVHFLCFRIVGCLNGICSNDNGLRDCFQFGLLGDTINMLVCVSVHTFQLGTYLGVSLLGRNIGYGRTW